jgi:hypothetical protein
MDPACEVSLRLLFARPTAPREQLATEVGPLPGRPQGSVALNLLEAWRTGCAHLGIR